MRRKSKHTPSPWEIRGQHVFGVSLGGCRMDVTDFRIADIRGWGHLQCRDDGEEVQDANARVLAAAPEMHEALERIEAICADRPHDPDLQRVNAIAGKVLDKASGK